MEKTFAKKMTFKGKIAALVFSAGILGAFSISAHAQAITGMGFSHEDWEVSCDNTGTCRAAGYNAEYNEDNDFALSVLLTRKAGAKQAVTGELVLGDDGEEDSKTLQPKTLELLIGDKSYGKIACKDAQATLSAKQVEALLNSVRSDQVIAFMDGESKSILSGQGMSAVFLKMDDFQKRVGTTGAIVRKGDKLEADVLKPQPMPVVTKAKTLENDEKLKAHYLSQNEKLLALTKETFTQECKFDENDEKVPEFDVYPLNDQQALLTSPCWLGAYNYGSTFWLVDKDLTSAELITASGTDYENGHIWMSQKGRGIGDCWGAEEYSWDGKQFVMTGSHHTGMCRGQPGGYWNLPILVYEVVEAK